MFKTSLTALSFTVAKLVALCAATGHALAQDRPARRRLPRSVPRGRADRTAMGAVRQPVPDGIRRCRQPVPAGSRHDAGCGNRPQRGPGGDESAARGDGPGGIPGSNRPCGLA